MTTDTKKVNNNKDLNSGIDNKVQGSVDERTLKVINDINAALVNNKQIQSQISSSVIGESKVSPYPYDPDKYTPYVQKTSKLAEKTSLYLPFQKLFGNFAMIPYGIFSSMFLTPLKTGSVSLSDIGKAKTGTIYDTISKLSPELAKGIGGALLTQYALSRGLSVFSGIHSRQQSDALYGSNKPITEHMYQGYRLFQNILSASLAPMTYALGTGTILSLAGAMFDSKILSGMGKSLLSQSSSLSSLGLYGSVYSGIGNMLYSIPGLSNVLSLDAQLPVLGSFLSPTLLGAFGFSMLGMGISFIRSLAMKKYRPKQIDAYQLESQTSASSALQPYIIRAVQEDKNISSIDVLQLQVLMLIEAHTSIIPLLYNLLHAKFEEKRADVELATDKKYEGITNKPEIEWYEKPQKYLEMFRYKFDPFSQLVAFITSGKTVSQYYRTLFGKDIRKMEVEKQSQALGISENATNLLGTSASGLMKSGNTFESRILMLVGGIYDLLRQAVKELITIRKAGFGIEKSVEVSFTGEGGGWRENIERLIGGIAKTIKNTALLPVKTIESVVKKDFTPLKEVIENQTKLMDTFIREMPVLNAMLAPFISMYDIGKTTKMALKGQASFKDVFKTLFTTGESLEKYSEVDFGYNKEVINSVVSITKSLENLKLPMKDETIYKYLDKIVYYLSGIYEAIYKKARPKKKEETQPKIIVVSKEEEQKQRASKLVSESLTERLKEFKEKKKEQEEHKFRLVVIKSLSNLPTFLSEFKKSIKKITVKDKDKKEDEKESLNIIDTVKKAGSYLLAGVLFIGKYLKKGLKGLFNVSSRLLLKIPFVKTFVEKFSFIKKILNMKTAEVAKLISEKITSIFSSFKLSDIVKNIIEKVLSFVGVKNASKGAEKSASFLLKGFNLFKKLSHFGILDAVIGFFTAPKNLSTIGKVIRGITVAASSLLGGAAGSLVLPGVGSFVGSYAGYSLGEWLFDKIARFFHLYKQTKKVSKENIPQELKQNINEKVKSKDIQTKEDKQSEKQEKSILQKVWSTIKKAIFGDREPSFIDYLGLTIGAGLGTVVLPGPGSIVGAIIGGRLFHYVYEGVINLFSKVTKFIKSLFGMDEKSAKTKEVKEISQKQDEIEKTGNTIIDTIKAFIDKLLSPFKFMIDLFKKAKEKIVNLGKDIIDATKSLLEPAYGMILLPYNLILKVISFIKDKIKGIVNFIKHPIESIKKWIFGGGDEKEEEESKEVETEKDVNEKKGESIFKKVSSGIKSALSKATEKLKQGFGKFTSIFPFSKSKAEENVDIKSEENKEVETKSVFEKVKSKASNLFKSVFSFFGKKKEDKKEKENEVETKNAALSKTDTTTINNLDKILQKQIQIESSGNPNAVSNKGAIGIAQFMPSTWKDIWQNRRKLFEKYEPEMKKYKGIPDIKDVEAQKIAQRAYMKYLLDKYKGDIRFALAAYNYGEGNITKLYKKFKGDFTKVYAYLPTETKRYVKKILGEESIAEEKSVLVDTAKDLVSKTINKSKETISKAYEKVKKETENIKTALFGNENQKENIQNNQVSSGKPTYASALGNTATAISNEAVEIFDKKHKKVLFDLLDNSIIKLEGYINENVFIENEV